MDGISRKSRRRCEDTAFGVGKFTNLKRTCKNRDLSNTNAKMDVNKSILELNDDCLFSIFSHLNIWHLMKMEKVCERFKSIVQNIYKTIRVLDYEVLSNHKSNETWKHRYIFSLKDVKNISERLNPYIHTLKAASWFFTDVYYVLNDILKGSTGNLRNLYLDSFNIKQMNLKFLARIFVNLKVVELRNCAVTDEIEVCLQEAKHLEILNLPCNGQISGKCLTVLRNIKEINLKCCWNLKLTYFTQFCVRNPDLRSLNIIMDVWLSNMNYDQCLKMVAENLKSLESLKVWNINNLNIADSHTDFVALGDLQSLKAVEFGLGNLLGTKNINVDSCLLRLATWNTLEHLAIYSSDFTQNTLRALCSFTKLRVLKIRCNKELIDGDLFQMSFSGSFRTLKEFEIINCSEVTAEAVVELIKTCQLLTRITIYGRNISSNFISLILPVLEERPATVEIIAPWEPLEVRNLIGSSTKIRYFKFGEAMKLGLVKFL